MSRLQDERKKEKGKRKKTNSARLTGAAQRVRLFPFLLFTFAFALEFHIHNFHWF